jgi:FlaG/FlaF family flagellin (archaellin)
MKFIENKEAVSPVVGVMLMLVVTLIIAGVVSAFGGGLVSTTSATPQASISSSLTFGESLKVQHNGGDSIVGSSIDLQAKIVSGKFADMVTNVDLTNVILPRTGKSLLEGIFQTGDVFTVPFDDVIPTSNYDGSKEAQKGDLVTITIVDKNTGKQIASQTVTVQ